MVAGYPPLPCLSACNRDGRLDQADQIRVPEQLHRPCLTVLFLAFLSPVLIKDLVVYSRELLGAAPTISVQATLEKITNRFVKEYAFRKAEVYALKRGRSLMVVIYVFLSEERPVKQLDAIRLEMIKAMYTYSNFCDTDIVFTLDDRWVDYQTPFAIAGQKA